MTKVCDNHKKSPAIIYGACVGCELEALRKENEELLTKLEGSIVKKNDYKDRVARLEATLFKLSGALGQMTANHQDMKNRNAVLTQRPDLDVTRIPVYESLLNEKEELGAQLEEQKEDTELYKQQYSEEFDRAELLLNNLAKCSAKLVGVALELNFVGDEYNNTEMPDGNLWDAQSVAESFELIESFKQEPDTVEGNWLTDVITEASNEYESWPDHLKLSLKLTEEVL
jgi:predicted nuclease with TOPRIM domain